MEENPKVDFYFHKAKKWQEEITKLRAIVLSCGLTEELKWGVPCYTFQNRNIVLIHVFKEYCALLFFKGAFLHDTNNILIQQTENVQAARQVRFTNIGEIDKIAATIKAYTYEAIEVEKRGLKLPLKKNTVLEFPEELKIRFAQNKAFKTAFDALTPGRQRAYNLYFTAAKQSKTRALRVEKCINKVLAGKGLND
jgi:uncharacterized protein YdeI (YjbR/CyaY-like superfamily)